MSTIYTKVNDNNYKLYAEGTINEMFKVSKDLQKRASNKNFSISMPMADETGIIIYCSNYKAGVRTVVEIHICSNDRALNEFKTKNGIN